MDTNYKSQIYSTKISNRTEDIEHAVQKYNHAVKTGSKSLREVFFKYEVEKKLKSD